MGDLSSICAKKWLLAYIHHAKKVHKRYAFRNIFLQVIMVILGAFTTGSVYAVLSKIVSSNDYPNLKWLILFLMAAHTAINLYQNQKHNDKSKAVILDLAITKATKEVNRLAVGGEFYYEKFLEFSRILEADFREIDALPFDSGNIETMANGMALNKCITELEAKMG